MWSYLAVHVPHRLLFPILYDVIEKNEFVLKDLEPLMALLKQSLANATLSHLSSNYSLLKQLFLKLFTLRTTQIKQVSSFFFSFHLINSIFLRILESKEKDRNI